MFITTTVRAIPVLAILSLIALFTASFSIHENRYTNIDYVSREATALNIKIIALDKMAASYAAGTTPLDSLRSALTTTRLNYKKIEFYLAFHHAEFVKEHINGAPLLYIDRAGTRANVLEPEGLQVLDELVFSDNTADEKQKIAFLAKQLNNKYSLLHGGLYNKQDKGEGVTACRLQLVRMFTLGLAGFDTPGSVNALPEAQASLMGMRTFISENYTDNAVKPLLALMDKAIAGLEKNSFENLDRLVYLKTYIDPLYAQLGKLGYSGTESLSHVTGWNEQSTSIFSADFLDPYHYTGLTGKEDTRELRELGKSLFYNPVISSDGQISCASCHHPDKAFTDGVPKSLSSIRDKTVLRNAPTLLNAVYADRYFYDLRAFTLEQQAEHVIFSHDEFNTAYSSIVGKLQANKNYAAKFKKVFKSKVITREQFSKALASYVLSLQSFNSPFDKYVRNESQLLSDEAKNGFNLFMGKAGCATCHFAPVFSGLVPPLFSENESEILGVTADPYAAYLRLDEDGGRYDNQIYSEQAWIFERSFKTTTVRNAALTAPYFHNGAYSTLEEVLEFYNKGGGGGLGLTVVNQTLPPDPLGLTEKEKNDIIAFIKTLNDTSAAK